MRRWLTAVALLGMLMTPSARADQQPRLESACFAGGCFWCTEAIFEELDGVKNVTAGMMGGQDEGLTERQIARGEGGHAEVVFLLFDPAVIGYSELLEVFFATHDPTSINKQGADVGEEYRSAIFTFSDDQQAMAEKVIAEMTQESVYDKPIVTEVGPATKLHMADEAHQDYYRKKSDVKYCDMVITPKVEKFRKIFADKLKKESSAP